MAALLFSVLFCCAIAPFFYSPEEKEGGEDESEL
jgi:hypothetical protein